MYRNWKSVFAVCMAVLIGCLVPMGTMMAAEEKPEIVQETEMDSASDTDAVYDDEVIFDDNGDDGGEINADDENANEEGKVDDEVNADDENADGVIVDDEVNTGNDGIEVMSETEAAAGDAGVQAYAAAPVISIKWQGQNCTYDLGGEIDYKYVNNHDQAFECSANQAVSFSYSLDEFKGTTAEAKGTEKMDSLSWTEASSTSERISLSNDKSYVLYVKAVGADGQTTYARSGGIVVDTIAPEVTKLVNGGTYPEGTQFQVVDDNLESVKVNEVNVTSGWNAVYQVSANGTSTSCVIRLKDKAGNEKIYSINVSGKELAKDGVISASGLYSLKAGTPYQLGEGKWQVGGDKSVYSGGNTFYVKTDGDYSFTKR